MSNFNKSMICLSLIGCGSTSINYEITRQTIQCDTPRAINTTDNTLKDILIDAVDEWNTVANHLVLVISNSPDMIKVKVDGQYIDQERAGVTIWKSSNGCMKDTEVQISPFVNGIILQNVVRHEIGHVMGLGHRTNSIGLMVEEHPKTNNLIQIEPGTVMLVRTMYERK